MRLILFVLSVSAFADSLTLKDGRVLSGTYLGGSTTALRFLLGDRVETYPITAVDRIGFRDSVPAPAPARTPFGFLTSRHPHGNETNALTTPDTSGEQERFCEVLQNYRESVMRYTNEPNAIRRARCGNRTRSIGRTGLWL